MTHNKEGNLLPNLSRVTFPLNNQIRSMLTVFVHVEIGNLLAALLVVHDNLHCVQVSLVGKGAFRKKNFEIKLLLIFQNFYSNNMYPATAFVYIFV